ncbi:hypothetical protein MNV49_005955 [Pseudohyphozyma bogoriensis]|nr:hypothetical protein MNV49_005955 [Pseudohyphozyma bogoriensis]
MASTSREVAADLLRQLTTSFNAVENRALVRMGASSEASFPAVHEWEDANGRRVAKASDASTGANLLSGTQRLPLPRYPKVVLEVDRSKGMRKLLSDGELWGDKSDTTQLVILILIHGSTSQRKVTVLVMAADRLLPFFPRPLQTPITVLKQPNSKIECVFEVTYTLTPNGNLTPSTVPSPTLSLPKIAFFHESDWHVDTTTPPPPFKLVKLSQLQSGSNVSYG